MESDARDGVAIGLRARYQLAFGLSPGLRLSHHFGGPEAGSHVTPGHAEAGSQVTLGHAEARWALPLGPLRGELFVGAGYARTWSESELCMIGGACTPVDTGSFGATLEAGLTLAYPLADRYFVAATGEAVALRDAVGASGCATVGVTF